jgi:deoxyadenosine/deoxycytidine kinase
MIISIEGPIGIGKSTLVDSLWGPLSAVPHMEELDERFLFLLGEYNKDGSKAINLQNHILEMRTRLITSLQDNPDGRIHILERSSISDIVFANVMYSQGSMSHEQMADYMERASDALRSNCPDLVIQLSCTPEVAFNRAIARGRPEENDNDLEYFEMLHEEHETLIPEWCRELDIPVMRFDCTMDYPDPLLISREILYVMHT